MKIEIRSKKGRSKARHFVVKLPGPMADSSRLEPLHFVVNPLGFHLYIIQFLKYRSKYHLICQVFVSLSRSLLALLCAASICFKRVCLIMIICCIATPPSRPYKMTGLLPERLQYGLVCCCFYLLRNLLMLTGCPKCAVVCLSEGIRFYHLCR